MHRLTNLYYLCNIIWWYMELRQLKYFVKTAQLLNFSEAARQLFISQSTLSQQIRQLEGELGCDLFKRDSHTVALTESGVRLLPLAQKCMRDADDCVIEVANVKNLMTGTMNIGITSSFYEIFWHTMKEFLYTYKGVKLNVVNTNTENLIKLLREHKLDFALAYKKRDDEEGFISHELFRTRLCAIMPKTHPLAGMKKIRLDDMVPYPIAMPAIGVQGRRIIDEELKRHPETKLRVRIELNDANYLCNLVEQGSHLVTMLAGVTASVHKNLVSIPMDIENNEMVGCVHVLQDHYIKHSVEEFVRMLRESPVVRLM